MGSIKGIPRRLATYVGANRWMLAIALLPITAAMNRLGSGNGLLVERYYSGLVFRYMSMAVSNVTGMLPFSLGEFLIIFTAFAAVVLLIRLIARIVRGEGGRLRIAGRGLMALLVACCWVYFGASAIWNMNYNRQPVIGLIGIGQTAPTRERLADLGLYLVGEANGLREGMPEDKRGVYALDGSAGEVMRGVHRGYDALADEFPFLSGRYGPPKTMLFSKALSYMGLSGIYFPFTFEANVNGDMEDVAKAFTAAHESAHQRGFAKEDEANLLAVLTCLSHPDARVRYSGAFMAMIYVVNSAQRADPDIAATLRGLMGDGVRRDLAAHSEYWRAFETPVREAVRTVNDAYLKANRQEDGVRSYGNVTDHLISWFSARGVI
ncbi:MAG: DUF3810 domain-containing protein [Oscillospiraceae bacterium]|nr:DUF3810 domain-containing protein [Oscillospiraceae bacterium]